jgi:DNA replication protein DnaC
MRPLLTKQAATELQAQIARIRENARAVNAARAAEAAERERAERAAFTGRCFACRDTGYRAGALTTCDCAQGQSVAQERKQRQIAAVLDAANIPPRCAPYTFASFPAKQIAAYSALVAFLREWDGQQGLILKGDYSTGKTGLLIASLREVASRYTGKSGAPLHFTTGADLLDALRHGYEDGTHASTMERAKHVALLAIDDLGAEKPSEWVIERLFVIVNARYEAQRPTFITTNYGLEDLEARIGPRILERLMETSRVITVDGPRLRLRVKGGQS